MKGYYTGQGFYGLVEGRYVLFSNEEDYFEQNLGIFDTFKRRFTSNLLFLRTFPNRSDHCIFLDSICLGSN